MMNAKISQKHDNMNHTRKNYELKSTYEDKNEYIKDTLSLEAGLTRLPTPR